MPRKRYYFLNYDWHSINDSAIKKERQVILIMKLRPLGNRVVLQQQEAKEKTQSGIILPDSAKEKPQDAVVIAVGPGKGDDEKCSGMQVKEGDKVIYSQYAGTEVKIDDEEYIIVDQSDIMAIVE